MANNLNIGSIVSPDVLKVISSSTAIKTFGNQLVNKAKDKVISVSLGKIQTLKDQIQEIITLQAKVWFDHGTEMKRLEILLKEKQITEKQYNKSVEKEEAAYKKKLANLEDLNKKLNKDLNNLIADPKAKIKEKFNRRNLKLRKRQTKNKAERVQARRDLTKKVLKNAVKTLAPIIALQIANQLSSIISQRAKLEELVDQVNIYIEQANTPETIIIATNLRNNAITLINNSIKKLDKLKKNLENITKILAVIIAIIIIIEAILLLPFLLPIKINLQPKLQKILKLAASLSVILAIANTILENEISKLNDLIERLKAINALLDDQANLNLNEQQLANLSNTFLPIGNNEFEEYKGFKFKIKEEQNIAFVVKGNKRRYAVAIDRDGVEVIKSELSFTLDPQDLIDQLKLVIDQRNLQG